MNSRIWIRRKQDKSFSPATTSKYDLRKMKASMHPGAMYSCPSYGTIVFVEVKDLSPTFIHIDKKGNVRVQRWNNWENIEDLMSRWKKIC